MNDTDYFEGYKRGLKDGLTQQIDAMPIYKDPLTLKKLEDAKVELADKGEQLEAEKKRVAHLHKDIHRLRGFVEHVLRDLA